MSATEPAPGHPDLAGVPSHFDGLRPFVRFLEARGELRRITREIDPVLEVSEIAQRVMKLIDALEDNDDVQSVAHNAEIPESISA